MSNLIADIRHGYLKYSGHTVFNELNLQLYKGQHWAVAGPSGSGKTALLQIIAGKRPLNGGSIHYYFDDTPENYSEGRPLPIALINLRHQFRDSSNTTSFYYQQRYNSFDANAAPSVNAYLNKIVSHNSGITQLCWTMDLVAEKLRLRPLLNRSLIQLSNGETRRVLIAAALLKNPQLLLLDGPLTGLDAASRDEFNCLFTEIAASGITLVMSVSLHQLPDVITHVALAGNGTIVATEKHLLPPVQHPAISTAAPESVKQLFYQQFTHYNHRTLVEMHGINVTYNNIRVLQNINWTVLPGERWSLTGPNGSGKSTLLSLINGDNPQAYANDITLFGRKRGSGESIWDIKKNIGFISPELYQYFPTDQSCLQVIESGFYDTLGLYRPAQASRTAMARQWMQLLGLNAHATNLFKLMPAGAQRLCLLARALVKAPPLLILDEPCQGLDDEQQENFKQLIDSICAATPVSIIYVTHYPQELPLCVQHHLHLKEGRISGLR